MLSSEQITVKAPTRVLGVAAVAFASFNCIVGAGIFGMPSFVAKLLGPAAVLGYLIATLLLGLIGLCLAEVGSRVIDAGGPFAYATAAFGSVVGGIVGTLMWTSCLTASAAVANLSADTLASLWPAAGASATRGALMFGVYVTLAIVNLRSARQGSWASVAFAIIKLVPLLGIVLVGIFTIHWSNLRWTAAPPIADVGSATVFLFYAFVGVEVGMYASAEVKDARRTMPRAILLATSVIALLYIGIQVVCQGVLGSRLPDATAPLVSVAEVLFGPWGARLMAAAVLLSTFGYLVADALCSPRAIYALAGRGQLPAPFAKLHPRFGTPALAVCVYQALCFVLAVTGSFEPLAMFTGSASLVTYAICCMALLPLRSRQVEQAGPPFRAPGGTAMPLVTTALIGWLLLSLSVPDLLATLTPVAVSGIVYTLLLRRRRALSAAG